MIGLMKRVRIMFRTTLADQSRDRRSVGAAFIYALAGPLLLLAMFKLMAGAVDKEQPPKLAVYGAERAPELVAALGRSGAEIDRRTGDPDLLARERPKDLGPATVALLIPRSFEEDLRQQRPSRLVLLRDERRRRSMSDSARVEKQLRSYAERLTGERFAARSLPATAAQPFKVEGVNVAATAGKALGTARMIIIFFILAPFFTSMTAAIDSTAGERERQSLKPLLAQPVSPAALVLGKWGVSSLFGILGTAATIVLGLFLLRFAPLDALGIKLRSDFGTQAAMILLLLPLALAVAALQSLVAMLAKSFKEAQTYIQLITFAPLGVLMVGAFSDQRADGGRSYMPMTGHAELLTGLLAEGRADPLQAALVTLSTLAIAVVALVWAQRQLGNEKLLGQL